VLYSTSSISSVSGTINITVGQGTAQEPSSLYTDSNSRFGTAIAYGGNAGNNSSGNTSAGSGGSGQTSVALGGTTLIQQGSGGNGGAGSNNTSAGTAGSNGASITFIDSSPNQSYSFGGGGGGGNSSTSASVSNTGGAGGGGAGGQAGGNFDRTPYAHGRNGTNLLGGGGGGASSEANVINTYGGSGGNGCVLVYFQETQLSTNNETPYALVVNGDTNIKGGLSVDKNIYTTSITYMSDYRVKENVQPLDLNIYKTDNLRPVSYLNKLNNKFALGVIAHELQEQYSFLVEGQKDGEIIQSVDYTGLIPILIKEIQELKRILKQNNIE
jgi:hypothetical protein